MNPPRSAPIPEVFVLWHPACPLGETLARSIHSWLRPGNGLGPEVFFRSLPAPEAPEKGLPPPLPGEPRGGNTFSSGAKPKVSDLQIVLPLIDEHMVADPAWRYWITEISGVRFSQVQRVILPVALDASAFNMRATLRHLNYLRPKGLPVPTGDGAESPSVKGVTRSLLKQLTEAMCNLMLSRPDRKGTTPRPTTSSSESLPKVKIFLSHAKADGTGPARRLRDYIYSQTQLAAFYDENDISYGSQFSRIIKSDLDSPDTAALIAFRSEQYARRPWCRRELSLFRRPRPEKQSTGGNKRWRLYPSLVVDSMEGGQMSAGIPELGNSPIIRWDNNTVDLEELIVTTVLRDAMLASFHSAMGASIPAGDNQIILNWLPDPTTLLHIPSIRNGRELNVIHPGRGLSGLELDNLFDFFPKLTFHSFEEKRS